MQPESARTNADEPVDDRERLVSRAFVELADTMVADYDIMELLNRLVTHSVRLLAADAAGIMLADARGELQTVAASSEDARFMELLQLQAGDGPCLECFRAVVRVGVADLARTTRWPAFAAAARDRGAFRAVHALPLRLRGEAIGALNLFHRAPGAMPTADLELGQALADTATIGILSERAIRRGEILAEQLQTALNSRTIIEQAKGVLAQQAGLTMQEAFERLRRYARDRSMRLVEVARQVVARELDLSHRASPSPQRPRARPDP